jgi:hypothetical protein
MKNLLFRKVGDPMSVQHPWNRGRNTSDEIADEDDPRYETPGGSQHKADTALQDAKDYTDDHVNQTANIADLSVTRPIRSCTAGVFR